MALASNASDGQMTLFNLYSSDQISYPFGQRPSQMTSSMSVRSTSIPFKLVYLVRLGEDILHHYGGGVVLARTTGVS